MPREIFESGKQEPRKWPEGFLSVFTAYTVMRSPSPFVNLQSRARNRYIELQPLLICVIRAIRGSSALPRIRVHSYPFVVKRNQLDGELRRQDKGVWGTASIQKREQSIAPKWHGKIHRTDPGKRICEIV